MKIEADIAVRRGTFALSAKFESDAGVTRRMDVGASGFGASPATISWIWIFVLPRIDARRSRWLSGLRCGASSLTAVR